MAMDCSTLWPSLSKEHYRQANGTASDSVGGTQTTAAAEAWRRLSRRYDGAVRRGNETLVHTITEEVKFSLKQPSGDDGA